MTRAEKKNPRAGFRKLQRKFEIDKRISTGRRRLERVEELGNRPLSSAKFAQRFSFRIDRLNTAEFVKSPIGRLDAQVRRQNHEWLANRVHDALRVGASDLGGAFGLF